MRAYTRGERCLMQLLQESLDDPSPEPCGRCSVCLGRLPEPFRAAPEAATVAAVTRRLRGEVTVLEPRKMWPGGAFGRRGRIPAGLMAEPGGPWSTPTLPSGGSSSVDVRTGSRRSAGARRGGGGGAGSLAWFLAGPS